MIIHANIDSVDPKVQRAIALGAFDGIHKGHMSVIEKAVKSPYVPSVFTFSRDPSEYTKGTSSYLMTKEDKEDTLRMLGVKEVFSVDFSTVRDMEPQEFFNSVLVGKCGAKVLSCGENFRFGKNAAGDTELLKKLCDENGIKLIIAEPVTVGRQAVSSTAIRKALENGDAELAEQMLTRPFGFTLPVAEGNRIGRTLGTPTINQQLPQGFVRPKFGVYAAIVTVGSTKHWGVANIGVKPTIGNYEPLAETWIGEFDGDLYGKNIRLELLRFIRPEKKFGCLDELKAEIYKNAAAAEKIVEEYLKKSFT